VYNFPMPLLCDLCVRSGKSHSYMIPLQRLTAEGKPEPDHPYRCGIHESRQYSKFLGYYSNYPAESKNVPAPLALRCTCGSLHYMYLCGISDGRAVARCIECGEDREETL
jgi:hypothetical protein